MEEKLNITSTTLKRCTYMIASSTSIQRIYSKKQLSEAIFHFIDFLNFVLITVRKLCFIYAM